MHSLIIGRTRTGKTSLALELGSEARLAGIEVLGFNPLAQAGFTRRNERGQVACDWETDDAEDFLDEVAIRCGDDPRMRFLIIDEAQDFFPRAGGAERLWLATQGRHDGLNLIIVTQRAVAIHPTVQAQCSTVYAFACSLKDAQFAANEFGAAELAAAPELPPGRFLKRTPDGLTRGRLW